LRVRCLHGYFIFQELRPGQISDFMYWSGISLVSKDDYYTFPFIKDAPNFSLPLLPVLGVPATHMFEGQPWDVFRENGLVFDFTKNLVVPILSVVKVVSIAQAGNKFISPGLILPGSLTDEGKRVTDYAAWFSRDRLSWTYSEVSYA
jgi:hypothetical protein